MKAVYFLRTLAVMMLMALVTNVTAKDITVRDGSDTELAAALAGAEAGDNIIIRGWVEFAAPITVEVPVHFIGADDDSGFDGLGASKLFELTPSEDGVLTFENLVFTGGYNTDDGGIGRILRGTTEFKFCSFGNNETTNRGGAFYIANPEDGTTAVVNFKGCRATNNKAGNRGGFIFVAGDAETNFEYCSIKNNRTGLVEEPRGGALFLEGGYHNFFYTNIQGNQTGEEIDGLNAGGGAIVTAGSIKAITMESCSVVGNTAHHEHGGAFFVMGEPNITLVNTTIASNVAHSSGSWFIASGNCDITFVNSILAENKGMNSGNAGGGMRIMNTNNRINVFNSILARNLCSNDEGAIDMHIDGSKPGIESTLVFKNSIIGLIAGLDASRIPAAQDNAGIPTKSLINMYSLGGEAAQPDYLSLDRSGVDWSDAVQFSDPFGLGYYTLNSASVYAAKLGDPALLGDYTTKDALGEERDIAADGSIFAGPVQEIIGYEAYDDSDWEEKIDQVSIPVIATAKQSLNVINNFVSNGILGVDFGTYRGAAKGQLISLNGQVVETVFNLNVNGKGFYNVNAAPGFYILKTTINGQTFANRVIVK